MANTPSLLGAGAGAFSMSDDASEEDAKTVELIMSAVGLCYEVPERLMDAVTGLSGSGPAYVYMFIEALADGGVKQGLPRDVALKLAAQTVYGAARMVLETGIHPAQLKDNVASPGGTTIEAIHKLESLGFRNTVISAIESATEKSSLMGKNL